jgi:hypothetical protein
VKLRDLLRPIRVRLTLWYVLLLAVVLAWVGGTLYAALRVTLYDDLDDVLINGASLVIGSLQTDDQGHLIAGPKPPLTWSDPKRGEHLWRALDRSGQIVAQRGVQDLGDLPIDPAVIAQALAGQEVLQTVCVGDDPIRVYTAPVTNGGQIVGVVQQALSLDDTLKILAAFR